MRLGKYFSVISRKWKILVVTDLFLFLLFNMVLLKVMVQVAGKYQAKKLYA